MRNRRGQVAVIDFFIALGLFLIMLMVIIFEWNLYSRNFNDNIDYNVMVAKTGYIGDVLVGTEGIPSDWNYTDVTLPGLVSWQDRNLSASKVMAFKNLTSDEIKDMFDVKLYAINFSLVYSNGSRIFSLGTDVSAENIIVNTRRYATYNNETVYLDVQIGD